MYDLLSALPPDMLLRHVQQRQAEVRDGIAQTRPAAREIASRAHVSRRLRQPGRLGPADPPSPTLGRLWSALGRFDR